MHFGNENLPPRKSTPKAKPPHAGNVANATASMGIAISDGPSSGCVMRETAIIKAAKPA